MLTRNTFRRIARSASRRQAFPAAVALALVLAGCTSKADRAAQYDAMADQMMAVQAYPAAVGALQRGLKLDSNNSDRWLKVGRAERLMGNDPLAATAYQRALDLAPDNTEALQALSVLLVRGGQYDMAKTYVSTLMVLAPDDLGGLLAQGAIALHESRLIDADKLADRLMTIAPALSEGFVLKARVIETRGDVAKAAEFLTKRLQFDQNNIDLASQVLRLDRLTGNRDGIRNVSLTLAKLIPDDPRYQLEAARTLRARGKADEADAIMLATETRFRGNPQVMLGVAHQWLDTMPKDAAIARIETSANAAPAPSRAALATLLVQLGLPDRALALLTPALGDKVDRGTVDIQAAYAGALFAANRVKEARVRAEQVLAFDYHNSESLLVRAKVEAIQRDYGHALDDAQLVMSQDPQNAEAPLLVALWWAQQGNAVLADKAFGTAQDRFPDDLPIHRARIGWLVSQGRVKDAASLATSFANQHAGIREATVLMASTCKAAGDVPCMADARQRLTRS